MSSRRKAGVRGRQFFIDFIICVRCLNEASLGIKKIKVLKPRLGQVIAEASQTSEAGAELPVRPALDLIGGVYYSI